MVAAAAAPALTRTTAADQWAGGGRGQPGLGMLSNQAVRFPPGASETFSQLSGTLTLTLGWGAALCAGTAAGHQGAAGRLILLLFSWAVIGCHLPQKFFQT